MKALGAVRLNSNCPKRNRAVAFFLHYSADWMIFHDKMYFHLHNSKKNSIFAAETEDGAAGGAHAELFH